MSVPKKVISLTTKSWRLKLLNQSDECNSIRKNMAVLEIRMKDGVLILSDNLRERNIETCSFKMQTQPYEKTLIVIIKSKTILHTNFLVN